MLAHRVNPSCQILVIKLLECGDLTNIVVNMPALPILSVIPKLCSTLLSHDEVILEAPPGAGKTTQVPLSLLNERWLAGQKILMLEPRRLAAKTAANRMASMLGEHVGETIGYRIRLEQKISSKTRIEIVTEGILTRLLQSDPSLDGYGLIIFDEFHERSLDADLGLALTHEARSIFRDEAPLKLLIMSATLDGEGISTLLGNAPIIRSEGRHFPIKIVYTGQPKQGEWLEKRIVKVILQALEEQEGSLLCFLPGIREIKQVQDLLNQTLLTNGLFEKVIITPLYGDLKLEQQQQAIHPAPVNKRKIVLATSIAETSLTIDGVNIVVDSGLARGPKYDPNTAMTRLFTQQVSSAASTQRAGRAGRLAPGVCYRLWNESQQSALAPFTTPEILQADLTGLALQLASWDINEPRQLLWLSPPPEGAYAQARQLLMKLGALNGEGKISQHGEQMAEFPAHPRISHMLLKAALMGLTHKASRIAALLLEKDPLRDAGADINIRLEWLEEQPKSHRALWKRLRQQANNYQKLSARFATTTHAASIPDHEQAGLLLAFAYPDRVAKQRSKGSLTFKMSNGRAASFFNVDNLTKCSWLTIAQIIGKEGQANDYIPLAAELNPSLLPRFLDEVLKSEEIIHWDKETDRIIAERQQKIGNLTLASETLQQPSEEAITRAIIALIHKQGLKILPWNNELTHWRQRVIFLHDQYGDDPISNPKNAQLWPDLSDRWLLDNLNTWLGPYLSQVKHINHLKKLDLKGILHSLLPWPLPQRLDKLAPERYRVPSGSSIAIDYSQSPPVLAVKLQEMFGCAQTPCIANNLALQLHLLSPARRPLQVTQDLSSFWSNAYIDVQKDMKGRYPKHPWPDNPLAAIPTAKTKKKMT